jgi:endoglucanase
MDLLEKSNCGTATAREGISRQWNGNACLATLMPMIDPEQRAVGRWPVALAALTVALAAAIGWFEFNAYQSGTGAAREATAALTARIAASSRSHGPQLGSIDQADWTLFKTRFIRPDGELIDNYSHLSHSEGQGYAMLLAVAADDRPAFDHAWQWTRTNLQHDHDALLAWKWQPNKDGGGTVGDENDAADGDILAAWALHRAAERWHDPVYDAAATPIAHDILAKLVRDVGGFAVLLPGEHGFVHQGRVTVNLSYWIFPAFRSLNRIAPSLRWYQLERSGLYLLAKARFGPDQLPADWIVLTVAPTGGLDVDLARDRPLSGYDAIRIPLYLMWDSAATPANLEPFLKFWRRTTPADVPATVNLETGATASYPMLPGMSAIVDAVETRASWSPAASDKPPPPLPPLRDDHDYYSAALGLLVRLALNETSPR